MENYQDGGQRSARDEASLNKIDGKNADDFLEWSSKLRVSLSLYSKPIFEIVQGSQRPSGLDDDQVTARESWDDVKHHLFIILFFTTFSPAFSIVRRFIGKTREDGVGHGQDAWGALRERAAHRELETVKMRSDEDSDDFLCKKDRCRDHLYSVTPKEGPLDHRYEDIILQCFPSEYDMIRQTHFEREDCNLEDIRRMMSKIYAEHLARSHSYSSRGIAGRGVTMQATGRNFSKINCYCCNSSAITKRLCRLQGSPSPESATQTTAPQAARWTSTGSAEAGRTAASEGRGGNVVLISQNHHPQRRRLPRHVGKRAQRQRPRRPSSSSERSWDLQFVGPP